MFQSISFQYLTHNISVFCKQETLLAEGTSYTLDRFRGRKVCSESATLMGESETTGVKHIPAKIFQTYKSHLLICVTNMNSYFPYLLGTCVKQDFRLVKGIQVLICNRT